MERLTTVPLTEDKSASTLEWVSVLTGGEADEAVSQLKAKLQATEQSLTDKAALIELHKQTEVEVKAKWQAAEDALKEKISLLEQQEVAMAETKGALREVARALEQREEERVTAVAMRISAAAKLQDLEEQLRRMREDRDGVLQMLLETERQGDADRQVRSTINEEHTRKVAELEAAIQEYKDIVKGLGDTLECQRDKHLEHLNQMTLVTGASQQALKEERDLLQDRLSALEQSHKLKMEEFQAVVAYGTSLQLDLDALKAQNAVLSADKAALSAELESTKATLIEVREACERSRVSHMETAHFYADIIKNDKEESKVKVATLELQITSLEQTKDHLLVKVLSTQQVLDDLRKDLDLKSAQYDDLRKAHDACDAQVSERFHGYHAEVQGLHSELSEMITQKQHCKAALEDVQSKLDMKTVEHDATVQRANGWEIEAKRLRDAVEMRDNLMTGTKKVLEESKSSADFALNALGTKQHELTVAQDEVIRLRALVKKAEEAKSMAAGELKHAQDAYARVWESQHEMKKQVQVKEAEIAALKQELSNVSAADQVKEAEIAALKQELSSAADKVKEIAALNQELSSVSAALASRDKLFDGALASRDKQVASLQSELGTLRSSLNESHAARVKAERLVKESYQLHGEVSNLKVANVLLGDQRRTLEERLARETARMAETLLTATTGRDKLEAELRSAQAASARDREVHENVVVCLKQQLEAWAIKNEAETCALRTAAQGQVKELQSAVIAAEEKAKALQVTLDERVDEIIALSASMDEAEVREAAHEDEESDWQDEIRCMTDECQRLQHEVLALKAQVVQQTKVAEVKAIGDVAVTATKVDEAGDRALIAELERRLEQIRVQNVELRGQLRHKDVEIRKLTRRPPKPLVTEDAVGPAVLALSAASASSLASTSVGSPAKRPLTTAELNSSLLSNVPSTVHN